MLRQEVFVGGLLDDFQFAGVRDALKLYPDCYRAH